MLPVNDFATIPEKGIDNDLSTYSTITPSNSSAWANQLEYLFYDGKLLIGTKIDFEITYQFMNTLNRTGSMKLGLPGIIGGSSGIVGGDIPYSLTKQTFNLSYTTQVNYEGNAKLRFFSSNGTDQIR